MMADNTVNGVVHNGSAHRLVGTDLASVPRRGAAHRSTAESQGFHLRSGGAVVPRMRRLRHPRNGPHRAAAVGPEAGEHRLRIGHRLLVAVPVLPRHVRRALDPRTRPDLRHRPGGHQARPVGVGRDRRRRCAVDRRESSDPRSAPQREHADPVVQQPHLRADERAVLAHVGNRQGHQVDADGSIDAPFNTMSLAIGAEASFVARVLDSDRAGLTEILLAAAEHRGAAFVEILQDCPIFNDGSFDHSARVVPRTVSSTSATVSRSSSEPTTNSASYAGGSGYE